MKPIVQGVVFCTGVFYIFRFTYVTGISYIRTNCSGVSKRLALCMWGMHRGFSPEAV